MNLVYDHFLHKTNLELLLQFKWHKTITDSLTEFRTVKKKRRLKATESKHPRKSGNIIKKFRNKRSHGEMIGNQQAGLCKIKNVLIDCHGGNVERFYVSYFQKYSITKPNSNSLNLSWLNTGLRTTSTPEGQSFKV